MVIVIDLESKAGAEVAVEAVFTEAQARDRGRKGRRGSHKKKSKVQKSLSVPSALNRSTRGKLLCDALAKAGGVTTFTRIAFRDGLCPRRHGTRTRRLPVPFAVAPSRCIRGGCRLSSIAPMHKRRQVGRGKELRPQQQLVQHKHLGQLLLQARE